MKLISEQALNQSLIEMWDAVDHITTSDADRRIASDQAADNERKLREQYEMQQKAIATAWEAMNELSPNDPHAIAKNIKPVFHQLIKLRGWMAEMLQHLPSGAQRLHLQQEIEETDRITVHLIQSQKPIVNTQNDSPMV